LPAIDAMVTWADTLRQAPTQGLEPMANPHDMVLRLREDLAQPLPSRETLMRNAPQMAEGFFIVPRVVE
jgi:aspartyl-tRNA(Asn)/glutamyl-tRNA(Gln) amidotransferase subunit C